MQERTAPVFVAATSNNVLVLPPELIRKGRFDEIFFVDLPSAESRAELFALHLQRRSVEAEGFDFAALASAADGFSGAEIEQAIVAALYAAHASGLPLSEFQLRAELKHTRPLSVLMAEQVQELREWAGPRTVPAD
jgi:SpoVK/Ycf46/Vps4 family AAA+-type ATPase